MTVYRTRLRVRYAETDATGIVYYGAYFVYFEVGRVEMFRALGLPYDWRLPIVETHCRYRASARFDDLLEVETAVAEVRTRAFRLGQRVYRVAAGGDAAGGAEPAGGAGDDAGQEAAGRELLAEGYTVMMTQDEAGPCPLPPAFRAALVPRP